MVWIPSGLLQAGVPVVTTLVRAGALLASTLSRRKLQKPVHEVRDLATGT